jgi:ABC-2 type transport system permease protein
MNSVARTLSTEWLKLKRYKPFWVLFLLYPVCIGGVVTISVWTQTKVQDAAGNAGVPTAAVEQYLPFAFPHVWQSVAYMASWLHFLPAVLVILSVTNEFAFRTHRQNLLDGWGRGQFLSAKGLMASAICFYGAAVVGILALLAGISSGSTPGLEGASYILLFLLQSHVYMMVALLIAFVIRRAAISLAAFFIYSMILENFAAFLLNYQVNGMGNYLPLEVAGGLLPFPFIQEHAPEAAKEFLNAPSQTVLVSASVVYLFLFLGGLWARFRREDL